MRSGELRHRVTVQKVTTLVDRFGDPKPTYSPLATVWASVEPLTAREVLQAGEAAADVTHRVRLRYMPGVSSMGRVVFGDRTFEVTSVINPEERNRELVLLCQEEA